VASSVLVFPAGMPRSISYLETALSEGRRVIGASSLGHDPIRSLYPEWVYLPFITSPEFDDALSRIIRQEEIICIFTPNLVVWDYLNRCISTKFPGVRLVNASPVKTEVAPYRKALQFADSVATEELVIAATGNAHSQLSRLEMAALYHHADAIPGMCDHEKIRALCEIFRYIPTGDVVEIGSWWASQPTYLLIYRCDMGVEKSFAWTHGRMITWSKRTRKV